MELVLHRTVQVTSDDLARIERHPTLRAFHWAAEDVPLRVSRPVLDRIVLPAARSMFPIDWFAARPKS